MAARCQIVIPARLASTRLPEKLLRKAAGKSVLQHTFEAASRCRIADEVIVAVDHAKLAAEVDSFGGQWIMTSPNCASGTDRLAEVAASLPQVDLFINVQGDEPEIDPAVIDGVAQALIADPSADMATAGTPIRDANTLHSASCVKIVMAAALPDAANRSDPAATTAPATGYQRAIYFSRAVVPFDRDCQLDQRLAAEPPVYWHHLGLYAYRRDFLAWFATQPPSALEQLERLEQLRAIEAGKRILVTPVASATPGIDTQADLDAFIDRLG